MTEIRVCSCIECHHLSTYLFNFPEFLRAEELANIKNDQVAGLPIYDALYIFGANARKHLRRRLDILRLDRHDPFDFIDYHPELHPVDIDDYEARQQFLVFAHLSFFQMKALM